MKDLTLNMSHVQESEKKLDDMFASASSEIVPKDEFRTCFVGFAAGHFAFTQVQQAPHRYHKHECV